MGDAVIGACTVNLKSAKRMTISEALSELVSYPISNSTAQIRDTTRVKKSGHGPLFPDHVRTFVFSVHLFRTFSMKRVDQRWTFWRPKYLPPISNSATQIRSPGCEHSQSVPGTLV